MQTGPWSRTTTSHRLVDSFVDAGPLGREAVNAARSERSFTHEGVAGHPGDRGMQALADAIVEAVLQCSPVSR